MKYLRQLLSLSTKFAIITLGVLSLSAVALAAWSGPPAGSPPSNCTTGTPGCDAPVNVGSSAQIKSGSFGTLTGAISTHNGLLMDSLTADPAITSNNLYNKNGNLYWNGSQVSLGGSTIGGAGAVNYLTKWTAASTLGNSNVSDN